MKVRVIRNRWLPVKGFDAMNLFGCLLCRPDTQLSDDLVLHERIHTRQMAEMLFVGFYLWYVVEWLLRLPRRGNAYRNISFEREAYAHQMEPDYLSHRPPFAWVKYL